MQRPPMDRLADRAQGEREILDRFAGRQIAGSDIDLGHLGVVALQEGEQHVGQEIARALGKPAHDAKIDDLDRTVIADGHVSGMLVAVEIAVAERLVEEGSRRLGQHVVDVEAGRQHAGAVIHRNAGQALLGHGALGGAAPIDLRHPESGIA